MTSMHMMVGNVGTGKSEMAKHLARMFQNPCIVNMDSIAESIHGSSGVYNPTMKPVYHAVEETLIRESLAAGCEVIIDRTNIDKARRGRFIDIAQSFNAPVIVYEFPVANIPAYNMLENRMKESRGVSRERWQDVIDKMSASYEAPDMDERLNDLIDLRGQQHKFLAVDFDGTLCIPHQFPGFGQPNTELIESLGDWWRHDYMNRIIIWTCRDGDHVSTMREWLKDNNVPYDFINENPIVEFGGRKIFANRYIDDRNIPFGDVLKQPTPHSH